MPAKAKRSAPARPAKGPSLRDLARAAEVSPATISRIVAGNPSVDPALRLQVHRTARKLGINLDARRRATPKVLAFLLANRDVLHSFQARILSGAETYCSQHGWELLFMSFNYAGETPPASLHLPQLLSERTVARAAILGGSNFPNLFRALEARGMPYTVLGNNVQGEWTRTNCDVAYSNDIAGANDATAHLIAKGHRAIAFIGNLELPWFKRCATGYEQAMRTAGLRPRVVDLRFDGHQLGYLAARSLFATWIPVTAVLAGSDQVAAGVYEALREMNLSVPAQVSVIGVNDTQGAILYPPLTSVREFPEALGRHLAECTLRRLQDPTLPSTEFSMPTQLVHRASVAAPGSQPEPVSSPASPANAVSVVP